MTRTNPGVLAEQASGSLNPRAPGPVEHRYRVIGEIDHGRVVSMSAYIASARGGLRKSSENAEPAGGCVRLPVVQASPQSA